MCNIHILRDTKYPNHLNSIDIYNTCMITFNEHNIQVCKHYSSTFYSIKKAFSYLGSITSENFLTTLIPKTYIYTTKIKVQKLPCHRHYALL